MGGARTENLTKFHPSERHLWTSSLIVNGTSERVQGSPYLISTENYPSSESTTASQLKTGGRRHGPRLSRQFAWRLADHQLLIAAAPMSLVLREETERYLDHRFAVLVGSLV
jgi:hypothetical protein